MPRILNFGNISKVFKRRNGPIIQMRDMVVCRGVWMSTLPYEAGVRSATRWACWFSRSLLLGNL